MHEGATLTLVSPDVRTIPALDADDPNFGPEVLEAFRSIGFATVTGHGIDSSLFAEMRSLLVELFALSDACKTEGMITRDNYRGFIPLGFFTPNRAEINGDAGDQYEGYKFHWECPPDHPVQRECRLYGPNRWMAEVPQMRDVVLRYWAACDEFATSLLDVVAPALGCSTDELRRCHSTPLTNMTLLHYPPQPPTADAMGIHPHKDTNVLTFLHPDPVGGLEVRGPDGSWIEVSCDPDALVVNIGEMLELWSGGEFVATPHRVINRSGTDRYSFPYFLVPNHDVVVLHPNSSEKMPVGPLSEEVWRTNWPDQAPSEAGFDLGSLDR